MHFALLVVLLSLNLSTSGPGEEWVSLFNGLDLSGWRANVAPDSFTVEQGAIRARCTSDSVRSHLFYSGEREDGFVKFKNFELKSMVRGEPNSNSGIFFHTDFSTRDERLHLATGYEVQLNSSRSERRKTGSLYAVVDLLESTIDDTDWFEVHLVVRDKRILVYLDGQQVIDYLEPDNPDRPPNRQGRLLNPEGGGIALQAHDTDSIWYFKDIRVRRLPD